MIARRRSAAPGLALLLMLAMAQPAAALGTLDQSQTDHGAGVGLDEDRPMGQTFTAGLTGLLDTVSLYSQPLTPLDGFVIQIQTVGRRGLPSGSVLASQTIVSGPPDAWVQIAFTTPAAVTAATQYALVVVPPPTPAGWALSSSFADGADPYAGGTAVVIKPDGVTWAKADVDLAFETYVTVPPPPPSPAAGDLPNTATPGGEAMVPVATLALVGLASSAGVLVAWGRRPRLSRQQASHE